MQSSASSLTWRPEVSSGRRTQSPNKICYICKVRPLFCRSVYSGVCNNKWIARQSSFAFSSFSKKLFLSDVVQLDLLSCFLHPIAYHGKIKLLDKWNTSILYCFNFLQTQNCFQMKHNFRTAIITLVRCISDVLEQN